MPCGRLQRCLCSPGPFPRGVCCLLDGESSSCPLDSSLASAARGMRHACRLWGFTFSTLYFEAQTPDSRWWACSDRSCQNTTFGFHCAFSCEPVGLLVSAAVFEPQPNSPLVRGRPRQGLHLFRQRGTPRLSSHHPFLLHWGLWGSYPFHLGGTSQGSVFSWCDVSIVRSRALSANCGTRA